MPDLARLQSGDDREWQLLFDDLQWDRKVFAVVYGLIGAKWPQHVEDVRATALIKFLTAVRRCRFEGQLLPLLLRIGRQEAISFLRRASRREVVTADVPDFPILQVENLDRVRESIAAYFGHEDFELGRIVTGLKETLKLDELDTAILEQHIIQGVTQAELSRRIGVAEGAIARRKSRLLHRLRRLLRGLAP